MLRKKLAALAALCFAATLVVGCMHKDKDMTDDGMKNDKMMNDDGMKSTTMSSEPMMRDDGM